MSEDKTIIAQNNITEGNRVVTNVLVSRPVLLQYDGGAIGKRFVLTQDRVYIGRKADKVQVWIDDASVSREHCRIDFEGSRASVTDLGSLNHTYVNDQLVQQSADIRNGDMLRVGNVRLKFYANGSAEQLLLDKIYRRAVQDLKFEVFRRDYFEEKFDEEFKIAKAIGTHLSLIFFDLDNFKKINDTWGHDAGDLVLKSICQMVKTMIRPSDTLARYGGEEFCIILPRLGGEEAATVSERIRVGAEKLQIDYDGVQIGVTLSLGCTSLKDSLTNPQEMIKAADVLAYKSKQAGKNRVTRD